ncbi:hypothetical protein LCGC14_1207430 [marine sediment metagenome]|uniref:Uncharacterized protein n=1 Tax=marine sediment metagenome TaxID=412755 RepID=A0A0F9M2G2_9ZZZZ
MLKPWLFVGVSEALIGALAQTQIIPESMISIFAQLPLVAVIIWLQLQNQKWLERMLEVQRNSIKEIYDGQQVFLTALLQQMDVKQTKMADRIELLTQQVALFRETLGEAINIKDVIDRLMEEINKVQ